MKIIPSSDIKLHIGGVERRHGWMNLNIVPGPHVDYLGNITDLTFLADGSCAEVYASHVLEHLSFDGELQGALKGLHRILKPGGRLRVSVPDLEILCRMFLHPELNAGQRHYVMRMMFGGRDDEYDVHKVGLTFEFLDTYLREAGFLNVVRVEHFGEFEDSSQLKFGGHYVSVNVEARK